jgi:3-isopropylmalate/(R)-2-methylmalate dehydratase small subunit
VIAPSFNGLYFRNAFNLGLLLITCADAGLLRDGEIVDLSLDGTRPVVQRADGQTLDCEPIPAFLFEMVAAGGLLNQLRARFGKAPKEL